MARTLTDHDIEVGNYTAADIVAIPADDLAAAIERIHARRYPAGCRNGASGPCESCARRLSVSKAAPANEAPKSANLASAEVDSPAPSPSDSTPAAFEARKFILAGRAIFTLVGAHSRYTYKVTHKEATAT